MSRQFANRIDWIGIVHEYKPAHDCVKLLAEFHIGWITEEKAHIPDRSGPSTVVCPFNCYFCTVDPDHATSRTDEVGSQKGHVSRTGAHVENAHARADPSLLEEPASEGQEYLSLPTETLEFMLGMA
jgi:hypothetical protein